MGWGGMGAGGSPACVDLGTPGGAVAEALVPTGIVSWCYCRLDEPEESVVTATLALPDRSRRTLTAVVLPDDNDPDRRCATFEHQFETVPPASPMTFTASLSDQVVVDAFTPVVAVVDFGGWQPDEPVRLVVYAAEDPQDAWTKAYVTDLYTQADRDGRLRVRMAEVGAPVPATTVFAIGQASGCWTYDPALYAVDGDVARGCTTLDPSVGDGLMASVTWSYAGGPQYDWEPCGAGLRSRLVPGHTAVAGNGTSLLRAQAGLRYRSVGQARPGDALSIVAGPACADGAVWWSVKSERAGSTGWMRETDGRRTWLTRQP
jgi:hypothetical protein